MFSVACSSPTEAPGNPGTAGAAGMTSPGGSSSGGTPSSGGSTAPSTGGTASGGTSPAGGSAGAPVSSGGTGTGGSAEGGTAGSAVGGSTGGSPGGSAGSAPTETMFSRPKGKLPNTTQPATKLGLPRARWADGLVTPTILNKHHMGQPSVVNGYLVAAGNGEFWIYDIENIAEPELLSELKTPNHCDDCGPKAEGEAESHTVSFAKYNGKFYMVTCNGKGIDTWDITNPAQPAHLQQVVLPGIDYGDFTSAVWGLAWQGQYIYVGSTNNGIDIIDATNPAALMVVKRIPTSMFGNVSAGPLEAVGNILVVMTPKGSGGLATLDISDPVNPIVLDSFTTTESYIGMFYRHYAFLQQPLRVWDVLSNPANIGSGTTPLATLTTEKSEYMSFSDDFMFLGHLRPDAGVSKINITDPRNMSVTSRVWGRLDQGGVNDDQFTLAIGSVVVMGDDEAPYAGVTVGVHSTTPDTKPPVVDTIIPRNGEMGRSVKSRIGISFSDNIELATANGASFIVRPMGGQPLAGKWGSRMGVLNFDPEQDLQPATTYEVVLPQGGLTDLVGNALAAEFKSTFTTR